MTKKEYRDLTDRFKERSDFIYRATLETLVKESAEEQERRIKYLLKPENYGRFFNYYFGKDTPIPMADSDCAWYHEDVYKDLYHQSFITLFNLIFRGGAKSTHANLGYPLALKQSELAKFFLIVGANEVRASMLLQDLQVQLEANNRIINDFGKQKSYGNWTDGQFETVDRCTFMALGIDQPFRGLRLNGVRLEYVSIDDVEDKKRAKNKELTSEYTEKVTGDIQGAFSTRSERTIINNNYFVEGGFIEGLAKKKGIDLKKIDTKKTAVVEKEFSKLYLVNLTDQYYDAVKVENVETWKPEWPERFSKADCLRKIKQYENDKETLSGEFYNTPINVGKRIKESMIKMVEPLPLSAYDIMAENWDLAYGNEACHKAKATAGVDVARMQIVVTDVFCRQTDIGVAMSYHFTKAKQVLKENPAFVAYYDASVAQEAVYEPQWLQAARKHKCFHIPQPQKSSVDKYVKIDTVLIGALISGVLVFSRELEHNPDWPEAKAQMLNFEKGSKYPVDFPDALSDLIIQLQEFVSAFGTEELGGFAPIIKKRELGGY
jgi:hypothetical protein